MENSCPWFTNQIVTTAGAGPIQNQELELKAFGRDPVAWIITWCLLGCMLAVSRNLAQSYDSELKHSAIGGGILTSWPVLAPLIIFLYLLAQLPYRWYSLCSLLRIPISYENIWFEHSIFEQILLVNLRIKVPGRLWNSSLKQEIHGWGPRQ